MHAYTSAIVKSCSIFWIQVDVQFHYGLDHRLKMGHT